MQISGPVQPTEDIRELFVSLVSRLQRVNRLRDRPFLLFGYQRIQGVSQLVCDLRYTPYLLFYGCRLESFLTADKR